MRGREPGTQLLEPRCRSFSTCAGSLLRELTADLALDPIELEPDAGPRQWRDHARAARQSSTVGSVSASILPRRRIVLPAKSSSSS